VIYPPTCSQRVPYFVTRPAYFLRKSTTELEAWLLTLAKQSLPKGTLEFTFVLIRRTTAFRYRQPSRGGCSRSLPGMFVRSVASV